MAAASADTAASVADPNTSPETWCGERPVSVAILSQVFHAISPMNATHSYSVMLNVHSPEIQVPVPPKSLLLPVLMNGSQIAGNWPPSL